VRNAFGALGIRAICGTTAEPAARRLLATARVAAFGEYSTGSCCSASRPASAGRNMKFCMNFSERAMLTWTVPSRRGRPTDPSSAIGKNMSFSKPRAAMVSDNSVTIFSPSRVTVIFSMALNSR
jgi:hypothetical protein